MWSMVTIDDLRPNRGLRVAGCVIRRAAAAVVVAILATVVIAAPAASQADGDDVVISEIGYHPASIGGAYPNFDDREDAEFVELTNTSNQTVDLSFWCLTDAVSVCFGPGTTLAPGGFLVAARDADAFAAAAGDQPDVIYTGRLSNNDERLALVDDVGAVVDEVSYDSADPWPVTPDGLGPSLERVDLSDPEDGPAAWAASTVEFGTPGDLNSVDGSSPRPVVVERATSPAVAGSVVTITATIPRATSATLEYRFGFDSVQSTTMTNAGETWTAAIPARNSGLVRWRIAADGPGGTERSPRFDDTVNWWGYVVAENPNTDLPVLQWFMTNADYNRVYGDPWNNGPCGGDLCPSVVAYDGRVWDNVGFRAAGLTTRNAAKKSFRLDFPQGHRFEAPFFTESIDALTLDSQTPNYDQLREAISWEFMAEQGLPYIETQHAQIRRNGDFFGLYLVREEQDGLYRSRRGWDEGDVYKFEAFGAKQGWAGTWEKNEGLDASDAVLADLLSCLNGSVATRRACLPEKFDLPQVINELAAIHATGQGDQREFNWMIFHDRTTGLWQLFPDDLDRSLRLGNQPEIRCLGLDATPGNEICRAVVSVPEYEAMLYRRLRTMVDGTMDDSKWSARTRELEAAIALDWDRDENVHNRTSTSLAQFADEVAGYFASQVAQMRSGGPTGKVPGAQPAQPTITIQSFKQNNGDGVEWVRLANGTNDYVDVSDWTVTGLAPLPKGSVIAPNSTMLFVVDEAAWQAAGGDRSSLRGQVDGALGPELALLRSDGSFADQAGSIVGSPIVLNEWNAVEADEVIADGDATFGSVPGNGGDWFELAVVDDRVDIRGWRLVLSEDDKGRKVTDVLEFGNDPLLGDLRAGTIITINEERVDDVSFSPIDDDWTIDLQSADGDAGAYFAQQENFDTHSSDWQLAIVDAQGNVVFGPVGEGTGGVAGVGGAEVGELEITPTSTVGPASGYDDGDASTWGLPNVSAGIEQDFASMRLWWADPDGSGTRSVDDVQYILDGLTGHGPPAPVGVGDVDLDGSVSLLDALRLAQLY